MFFDCSKIISKYLQINKQPRRGQIYVGFQCHQRCGFCYYKSKCTEKMFNLDFIKKQIDFEYTYGIRDFEITGGEPSEYSQLRDICQYIKTKNNNSKIAIITNGGLWNCDVWDLIDEVLVSYHLGKNDKFVNKDIFPLGSTYLKAYKTIQKALEHNVFIRTNTVLGTFNLNQIDFIINDLISFQPNIINFLPVNLFDNAINMDKFINYSIFRKKIKDAIIKIKNNTYNTNIFIRYMPFCDMEGFEQYIVGHLQHIYDWFDWNRELDGTEFLRYIQDGTEHIFLKKLGKYGFTSIKNVMTIRNQLYHKNEKCLKCKYLMICDGVEKNIKTTLDQYIIPTIGSVIKDPLFYIKNITQEIYNNLYLS